MIDENCIFCKILAWQIPWVKIRENAEFVAILDAFPNRKWMTLLITKNHIDSDILSKDDEFIASTKPQEDIEISLNEFVNWLCEVEEW